MSLRVTGEGHVSSVEFRRGIFDDQGNVSVDPAPAHIVAPMEFETPLHDKQGFQICTLL